MATIPFSTLLKKGSWLKRRPKKSNPRAKKPASRHEKIMCSECGAVVSRATLAAHYTLHHPREGEQ